MRGVLFFFFFFFFPDLALFNIQPLVGWFVFPVLFD